MENPILARLSARGQRADILWLFTLFSVLDLDRYPLEIWNDALSAVMGRRVFCPSRRALARYLEEAARAGETGGKIYNSLIFSPRPGV